MVYVYIMYSKLMTVLLLPLCKYLCLVSLTIGSQRWSWCEVGELLIVGQSRCVQIYVYICLDVNSIALLRNSPPLFVYLGITSLLCE